LDVHKGSVVACVRIQDRQIEHEVRTFEPTTEGLLKLADWLRERGVTHAVMESTGPYWAPVWHVLNDGELTLLLANAEHVRNVPGRKTDVKDAVWLADLLAHGLVKASFASCATSGSMKSAAYVRGWSGFWRLDERETPGYSAPVGHA
jgi:transposase